ncbi:MAG TPA: amino acid ABC transporter substrate-binding protein [Burkholderiaceae bacterium]|nr:amino acid ABC transporter substrate-binding protein [Burkholderiaceae bacterium]
MLKTLVTALFIAAAVGAAPASAQSASPTLARIKAAKAINVAYSADSPPFSMTGPNNEPQGYSIDLCKRAVAQIGRAVGEPELKIVWHAGSVAERLQMVASGRAELECANTTQTLTRLANVDFSNLIFIDGGGLLVKAGAPINQFSDLSGKRVAVLQGTTTQRRLEDALRARLVNATVVPISDANEGIAMLEEGKADAYAGDRVKLVALAAQTADRTKLALVTEEFSIEPYALAMPRNDSAFRLEVNKALTQVYVSGDIERIFGQWMGRLGRPTGILKAMYLLNAIPE